MNIKNISVDWYIFANNFFASLLKEFCIILIVVTKYATNYSVIVVH